MILDAPPQISPAEERLLTRIAWAVSAVVAIALLVVALGPHRMGDDLAETDFYGAYAAGARLVQQGRLDPARYNVIGPGYEVALGVAGFAIPDLLTAAELLSAAAAVATMVLWFHLLRSRVGARVALAAILFLATNGVFFRHGYGALTDAPAMMLQAASLTALLAGARSRAALAAGMLAALAFLTRYNAIYLVPAGLIALLLGGARFERRGRAALLFSAGFLVLVAPWMTYSIAQGSGFSFQLHHNIAYEVYARSRDITWDAYQATMQSQFKNLWDVIAKDPGAFADRMLFNALDHLRLDAIELLGWPVALCAILGIGFGLKDRSLARLWPVWLAGALLYATLVPVFYSVRYSLPLVPIYATLAGIAFASPLAALGVGRGRRLWIKPALAVLPLAAALVASVRAQAFVLKHLPSEALECALVLDRLEAPGDRVIARKPHLAYHAGLEPVAFPFAASLAELAAYAREARARWLFFTYREADTRPRFGLPAGYGGRGARARSAGGDAATPGRALRDRAGVRPGPGMALEGYALHLAHDARPRLGRRQQSPGLLQSRWPRPASRAQRRGTDGARAWPHARASESGGAHPAGRSLGGRGRWRRGARGLPARGDAAAGERRAPARPRLGESGGGKDPGNPVLWRPLIGSTRDRKTLERMVTLSVARRRDRRGGSGRGARRRRRVMSARSR